ncbi:MAG: carbohydrate kinase family protein [Acidobacteria bacterium]|nr:carbohydrate kinase family protein [Acidobacteriota bacterium]
MAKVDVCIVGEINMDIILSGLPKELVLERELLATDASMTLGSSSAICAHNLGMLGSKVGFVSKIGNDPLGKMALERLAAGNVDVSQVKRSTSRTLTGLTVIMPHGQLRYIVTYPGTMFEMQFSDIDMGYVRAARHLHVSSFFLHRALRPRIVDLFRQAKDAGLSTSLDTNDDPENKWGRDLLEVLKYVDIFLPNDREAKKVTGTVDLSQALNVLAGLVKVVAVKRGSAASICRSGEEQWSVAPPANEHPVDVVGAGDTFNAGFLHMYLRGGNLEDCLTLANITAACSVTKEGGTEAFVNRSNMLAFVRQHWIATGRDAQKLGI